MRQTSVKKAEVVAGTAAASAAAVVVVKAATIALKRINRWRIRRRRRKKKRDGDSFMNDQLMLYDEQHQDDNASNVSARVSLFWKHPSQYQIHLNEESSTGAPADKVILTPLSSSEPINSDPSRRGSRGDKYRGVIMNSAAAAAAATASAATLTACSYAITSNMLADAIPAAAAWAHLALAIRPYCICISLIFSVFTAVRQLKLMSTSRSLPGVENRGATANGDRIGTMMISPAESSRSSAITNNSDTIDQKIDTLRLAERNAFLRQLEGTYTRNNELSDTLEGICDLLKINWLTRMAILLVRGLVIQVDFKADCITFDIFSVIPWFRITERYPLNGNPMKYKRRDLRSGQNEGSVKVWKRVPSHSHSHSRNGNSSSGSDSVGDMNMEDYCVELRLKWNEPFAGEESAIYSLTKRASTHPEYKEGEEDDNDVTVITYSTVHENGNTKYVMYADRVD